MHGFTTTLDPAILAAIAASAWTSVDFETTALSPSSPPVRLGSQHIGGDLTALAYQRLYGQGYNCKPRARVWSISCDAGAWAFDLDCLTHEETATLLHTSLHGKIVLGQNLSFDFGWALTYTDFTPARVIDVMLLARCLRPGVPWRVHALAADGDAAAVNFVDKAGYSEAGASLQALCIAYGLPTLDKDYQKPHNWVLRTLSPGHYDYCMGDIDAPVHIITRMAGAATIEAALERLRVEDYEHNGAIYHQLYQHAPLALARMTRRGLPVHVPTLEAIRADRQAKVARLLPLLYEHMPDMRTHSARLEASKLAVSAEMKHILAAYAAKHDCQLAEGEDGVPIIQRKKVALTGATRLEGWQVWDELQKAKKVLALCSEYTDYSLEDGEGWRRLHPLISARTVTLRCSSQAPNSQNLLRPDPNLIDLELSPVKDGSVIRIGSVTLDAVSYGECETTSDHAERFDVLQFRSIVRAPDGHKIVSVDQAQVELRIAAALAQRAIAEAKRALIGEYNAPTWVLDALRRGEDLSVELDEAAPDFAGLRDHIAATWRRVQQHGAALAEVFRRGLDPHLLTGLGMAAREGLIDLGGRSPVAYLSDPQTDGKALKKQLSAQRQSAKPANFGLLYGAQAETLWRLGVTDYGLSWTLEEATAVRALWLETYADVRFWQLWVQHVHVSPKDQMKALYRRNRYSGDLETKAYRVRTSRTLGGRPIYTPELREVLNHQDQSTGAEITTRAIVEMPEPARSYLCNAVHDELIAICPAEQAELVAEQIAQAFRSAMDRVLSPWGIPSGADKTIGDYWAKD